MEAGAESDSTSVVHGGAYFEGVEDSRVDKSLRAPVSLVVCFQSLEVSDFRDRAGMSM